MRWLSRAVFICMLSGLVFAQQESSLNAAPVTYTVIVDTSSAAGTMGEFYFQFNPSAPPPPPGGAQSATATISNFMTDGIPGPINPAFTSPPPDVTGGPLPGTDVVMNNTTILNEYDQFLTFGNELSFELTLSGDALDNPGGGNGLDGTAFFLSFFDDLGNPLFAIDPGGIPPESEVAAIIRINPDGTVTPIPGPNVVITQPIPEPETVLIFLTCLVGLVLFTWRRKLRFAEV